MTKMVPRLVTCFLEILREYLDFFVRLHDKKFTNKLPAFKNPSRANLSRNLDKRATPICSASMQLAKSQGSCGSLAGRYFKSLV